MSDARRGWRDVARALNRRPEGDWRERVLHHGFRLFLLAGAALAVQLLFPRSPLPNFARLEEGMVAPQEVIAQIPFNVRKSTERLEEERRAAEATVQPIFSYDTSVVDSVEADVDRFFAGLDSAVAAGPSDTAAVRSWLGGFGLDVSTAQLRYLAREPGRSRLRRDLLSAYRDLLPLGVVPASDLQEAGDEQVTLEGPDASRLAPRDSLLTLGDFYRRAVSRPLNDSTTAHLQLYQTLLVPFMAPTVRFDAGSTRLARQRARNAVGETRSVVLEGERIVAAHERVGGEEMAKLRAYRDALMDRNGGGPQGRWTEDAGSFLYALLLMGVLAGILLFHREQVYRRVDNFLIVVASTMLVLAAASWITRAEASHLLIPSAFAALVVATLYDGLLGVTVAFVIAALLAGQPPFAGVTAPFMALVGGSAAALGVPFVRRRAQSWVLIAAITGGYVVAGGALALLRYYSLADLATGIGWGAVNATLCTVLAMGAVVPGLERLTGITTDQTLLEFSDLNRPLLQRLSREAPGTYAHSINVANLAESACTAIDANALLARVGTYYHDIGKMTRPQYFIENQPRGRNPHDRLRPSRSASVIKDHVREGLRLADEAGVPGVIRDFIAEHHGTQRIVYFLDKARKAEPELDIDPADFAYPGPKPRSKETAVVMLADGVESATRSLRDPGSEGVRQCIEQIVEARIAEGQLDRCPLTLREIDRIKSEFARVLTGMYHQRIDYPGGVGGQPAAEPLSAGDDGTTDHPGRDPAARGDAAAVGSGPASGSRGGVHAGGSAGDASAPEDGSGDGKGGREPAPGTRVAADDPGDPTPPVS